METNCKNCGGTLKYEKEKVFCPYCGAIYHLDNVGRIEEYKVELEIYGKKRKFYIGEIEIHHIVADVTRNIDGHLRGKKMGEKMKINLVEI